MVDITDLRERLEILYDSIDGTLNSLAYLTKTQAEMCSDVHGLCRLLREANTNNPKR